MRFRIRFDIRDLWNGVYWTPRHCRAGDALHPASTLHMVAGEYVFGPERRIYVCLIPCVPLMLSWHGRPRRSPLHRGAMHPPRISPKGTRP